MCPSKRMHRKGYSGAVVGDEALRKVGSEYIGDGAIEWHLMKKPHYRYLTSHVGIGTPTIVAAYLRINTMMALYINDRNKLLN